MELDKLNKLNLLYIEDDINISVNYATSFQLFFKNIFIARNYDEAINIYKRKSPDIIIVDIELEGSLNGIEIVKKVRKSDHNIPIVFLTSHSNNKYLLEIVNLQVDGFITKPLDITKFQLSMLKCLEKLHVKQVVYLDDSLYYNFDTFELFKDDVNIPLGKKENLLLQLFLNNKNNILSRAELETVVWNDEVVSDSAIKNLIASLRKKIGKEKIMNISKIGWKIELSI